MRRRPLQLFLTLALLLSSAAFAEGFAEVRQTTDRTQFTVATTFLDLGAIRWEVAAVGEFFYPTLSLGAGVRSLITIFDVGGPYYYVVEAGWHTATQWEIGVRLGVQW